jgi:AcrR family transcriptional regulator
MVAMSTDAPAPKKRAKTYVEVGPVKIGFVPSGEAATSSPLTRAEKAAQTRADLMDAATRLYVTKGYEAASVADIAAAAGKTKGAFYTHFASKEDLFVTIIRELNEKGTADQQQAAIDAYGGNPVTQSDAEEGVNDIMLSLEAYLFALRRPELRGPFIAMAEHSLDHLTTVAVKARTGEFGEPTEVDKTIAMAFASTYTMGTVFRYILPPETYDVVAAVNAIDDHMMTLGQ